MLIETVKYTQFRTILYRILRGKKKIQTHKSTCSYSKWSTAPETMNYKYTRPSLLFLACSSVFRSPVCVCVCVCVCEAQCTGISYFSDFWQDCSIIKSIPLGEFTSLVCISCASFTEWNMKRRVCLHLVLQLFHSFSFSFFPLRFSLASGHRCKTQTNQGFSGQVCAAWVRGGRVVVSSVKASRWVSEQIIVQLVSIVKID